MANGLPTLSASVRFFKSSKLLMLAFFVNHDAPRRFLKRRYQRDDVRSGSSAEQNLVGVCDAKGNSAGNHFLHHRRVGTARYDFDIESRLFVIAVYFGRVESAVFRFGKPVQRQADGWQYLLR